MPARKYCRSARDFMLCRCRALPDAFVRNRMGTDPLCGRNKLMFCFCRICSCACCRSLDCRSCRQSVGSSVVRPVAGRLIAFAMTSSPARGYLSIYINPMVASLPRFASVMTRWLFSGIAPDLTELGAENESAFNILSHLRLQTLVRTDRPVA